MNNFCTNCGAKIRKDDNFCTNCGAKISKEDNFCTSCGTKIREDDNFCINCGAKIDRSHINQNPHFKSSSPTIEKEKAKKELKRVVGGKFLYNENFINKLNMNDLDIFKTGKSIRQQVEKEIAAGQIKSDGVESRVNQLILQYKIKNEEEKKEKMKKLKMVDDLFESEEIKSEIRKNKIDLQTATSIKDKIKNNLINNTASMNEVEIKYLIKTELEKTIKEQRKAKPFKEKQMRSEKINDPVRTNGGLCGLSCRHCYEEFLDSGGGIVGDFDSGGYTEYYCHLGHSIIFGQFCEDYE